MSQLSIQQAKSRLKHSEHPLVRQIVNCLLVVRNGDLPLPRSGYRVIFLLHQLLKNTLSYLLRVLYWAPLFKSQIGSCGRQLFLYGGMPYIAGKLDIRVGDNCRISGHSTFTGRTCHPTVPLLVVGNNVDIGWMTTIAVGNRVLIGNNVRIAGQALLAGYPGHPLEPVARAKGLPECDQQVGDIILEEDVWLATGVFVMAGVTIGRGSIIAASSVVTRDIPAGVLAGGIPATVIKTL